MGLFSKIKKVLGIKKTESFAQTGTNSTLVERTENKPALVAPTKRIKKGPKVNRVAKPVIATHSKTSQVDSMNFPKVPTHKPVIGHNPKPQNKSGLTEKERANILKMRATLQKESRNRKVEQGLNLLNSGLLSKTVSNSLEDKIFPSPPKNNVGGRRGGGGRGGGGRGGR